MSAVFLYIGKGVEASIRVGFNFYLFRTQNFNSTSNGIGMEVKRKFSKSNGSFRSRMEVEWKLDGS